jgi:hypothetical protein
MEMKNLHLILLFISSLVIYSCKEDKKGLSLDNCPIVAKYEITGNDTLVVCDISLLGSDTLDIPLSPLFSDFEVVQLESTDEALNDASGTVWISENHAGIYSYFLSGYKFYDRKGKYLNTTAVIGQGPDDIIFWLDDNYIDDKNKTVYLLGQHTSKLLVFDLDGKPKKHIPLAYQIGRGRFLIDTEKETLIIITRPRPGSSSTIWEQDFSGNIIREIPSSRFARFVEHNPANFELVKDAFNTANVDFPMQYWSFTDVDTFYHYQTEINRLQPVFTVNFGDNIIKHYYIELPDYYLVRLVNVSFVGADKPRVPVIIIDKKTLRGTYVRFKYDMLGNIDGQKWLSFNQGYCVSNMYPYELKEQLEEALTRAELLTSEMNKKLTELNNSIAEEGNNILLIGKLK